MLLIIFQNAEESIVEPILVLVIDMGQHNIPNCFSFPKSAQAYIACCRAHRDHSKSLEEFLFGDLENPLPFATNIFLHPLPLHVTCSSASDILEDPLSHRQ